MTTKVDDDRSPRQGPARSPRRPAALRRALRRCLAGTLAGRPAFLVHLEVAGARSVEDTAGREAVAALRAAVSATLSARLGERVALSSSGLCEFTLILEGQDRDRALAEVRAIKEAVATMRFRWHDHPFTMSVHAGVLELGPGDVPVQRWLGRAREACAAARELAGDGIQVMAFDDHAWQNLARDREWRRHISEIIA